MVVSNSHYLYMNFLCKIELQQTKYTFEISCVPGTKVTLRSRE